MAGLIPPMRSFTDWIKSITALKGQWSDAEFAESWRTGARMLLHSGTTTVADVEAVPNLLPASWKATPLRVFSFLEMIGVRNTRNPRSILSETIAKTRSLRDRPRWIGLSPHAPYSTTSALLRLAHKAAIQHNWRLVTHVAESIDEFDMFTRARGPLHDWLKRNQRDASDCGHDSPIALLDKLGYLSPRLIAVHVNHLSPGDAARLGQRGVHVVHCPRSHAYFHHAPFPHATLTRARVNVCLGTDSLATVHSRRGQPVALDLFAEMQAFADLHPRLHPKSILRMTTVHPARALALQDRIGKIAPGAWADLIALPYRGSPANSWAAALHHQGHLLGSMINGRWVLQPPHLSP
jgi:cytosine/adenosine deaminase-related metal-dependent hydrolase